MTAAGDNVEVNHFINDPYVKDSANKNPVVQRIELNRYFMTALLRYRAKEYKIVYGILPYLIVDGYVEDWITIMRTIIIPFIINNNVLSKTC